MRKFRRGDAGSGGPEAATGGVPEGGDSFTPAIEMPSESNSGTRDELSAAQREASVAYEVYFIASEVLRKIEQNPPAINADAQTVLVAARSRDSAEQSFRIAQERLRDASNKVDQLAWSARTETSQSQNQMQDPVEPETRSEPADNGDLIKKISDARKAVKQAAYRSYHAEEDVRKREAKLDNASERRRLARKEKLDQARDEADKHGTVYSQAEDRYQGLRDKVGTIDQAAPDAMPYSVLPPLRRDNSNMQPPEPVTETIPAVPAEHTPHTESDPHGASGEHGDDHEGGHALIGVAFADQFNDLINKKLDNGQPEYGKAYTMSQMTPEALHRTLNALIDEGIVLPQKVDLTPTRGRWGLRRISSRDPNNRELNYETYQVHKQPDTALVVSVDNKSGVARSMGVFSTPDGEAAFDNTDRHAPTKELRELVSKSALRLNIPLPNNQGNRNLQNPTPSVVLTPEVPSQAERRADLTDYVRRAQAREDKPLVDITPGMTPAHKELYEAHLADVKQARDAARRNPDRHDGVVDRRLAAYDEAQERSGDSYPFGFDPEDQPAFTQEEIDEANRALPPRRVIKTNDPETPVITTPEEPTARLPKPPEPLVSFSSGLPMATTPFVDTTLSGRMPPEAPFIDTTLSGSLPAPKPPEVSGPDVPDGKVADLPAPPEPQPAPTSDLPAPLINAPEAAAATPLADVQESAPLASTPPEAASSTVALPGPDSQPEISGFSSALPGGELQSTTTADATTDIVLPAPPAAETDIAASTEPETNQLPVNIDDESASIATPPEAPSLDAQTAVLINNPAEAGIELPKSPRGNLLYRTRKKPPPNPEQHTMPRYREPLLPREASTGETLPHRRAERLQGPPERSIQSGGSREYSIRAAGSTEPSAFTKIVNGVGSEFGVPSTGNFNRAQTIKMLDSVNTAAAVDEIFAEALARAKQLHSDKVKRVYREHGDVNALGEVTLPPGHQRLYRDRLKAIADSQREAARQTAQGAEIPDKNPAATLPEAVSPEIKKRRGFGAIADRARQIAKSAGGEFKLLAGAMPDADQVALLAEAAETRADITTIRRSLIGRQNGSQPETEHTGEEKPDQANINRLPPEISRVLNSRLDALDAIDSKRDYSVLAPDMQDGDLPTGITAIARRIQQRDKGFGRELGEVINVSDLKKLTTEAQNLDELDELQQEIMRRKDTMSKAKNKSLRAVIRSRERELIDSGQTRPEAPEEALSGGEDTIEPKRDAENAPENNIIEQPLEELPEIDPGYGSEAADKAMKHLVEMREAFEEDPDFGGLFDEMVDDLMDELITAGLAKEVSRDPLMVASIGTPESDDAMMYLKNLLGNKPDQLGKDLEGPHTPETGEEDVKDEPDSLTDASGEEDEEDDDDAEYSRSGKNLASRNIRALKKENEKARQSKQANNRNEPEQSDI